jgi:hypothetical protein
MPLFLPYEIKFPGWEGHGLERNGRVYHLFYTYVNIYFALQICPDINNFTSWKRKRVIVAISDSKAGIIVSS